jgi:acyl-coenzyme A thioesterase 13
MNEETNPIVQVFRASIGKKLEGAPPFTEWLDGRIVLCNPGELEVTFKVRPEMANPTGLLHGGIQSAIIDDLIGMTSATLGEDGFMLTIDLHVNFLGKVPVGQTIKARARILRSGKRIAHAVCEILDEQGNLVSRGDSNLVKTSFVPDYRKGAQDDIA